MLCFFGMEFRRRLTGKNLLILSVSLTLILVTAGHFFFGKPPRLPMEPYAPASALAFIEVPSLTEVMDGLTETATWRELAPVLGLSSQLRQLGSGIDWASRTGLGPDELVIAGRAQFAVVVTGVEANTEASAEGAGLHVKPRFALIAQTHAGADKATRLVNERASIIAGRIFGNATREEAKEYQGTRLLVYRGEDESRQLVAAAAGGIVLIGNHEAAVRECLDAIAGRTATLATDETLKLRRQQVGADAALFAYVTQAGIEMLAQLAPAVIATRVTSDPDRIGAVAGLFAHLSKQSATGFFYGLRFDGDGVTETYLLAMRTELAKGFQEALKPAATAARASLRLTPSAASEVTILNVEGAGATLERTLKSLSSSLDIVASLALREFVISLREQFGLAAGETLERAIGDEIAIVKLTEDEPTVMLVRVKDRAALAPVVNRYLTAGGAKVTTANYRNSELALSTHEDGRGVAFVGDFLILGSRPQMEKIIDAREENRTVADDAKVTTALQSLPTTASIYGYEADEREAAAMMLAISKLTRVTDGAQELLDSDRLRQAIGRLPGSASYTEFRDYGIYSQSRSALGILQNLADWLSP